MRHTLPAVTALGAAVAALAGTSAVGRSEPAAPSSYVNSIGMKMLRIEPGSFRMGHDGPLPAERLGGPALFPRGDWDERPVHGVRITYPFQL